MTSVLIIFEMTGGYGLVLPLMIANMSAFALARHWRHPRSTKRYWPRTASFYLTDAAPLTRSTTSLCWAWMLS
jgi:H+/Cl- antiporter ClcA